jgi:hypothetical protein
MKGTILDFSIQTGEGIISGDDNSRYKFAGSEWKASDAPARGQRVDFDQENGRAMQIYQEMLQTSASSRTEQPSNKEIKLTGSNKLAGQNTTDEKLLLDRVSKRSVTRDRMVANNKVRIIVSAIIVGLGLLSLIGTLAGGKEGVRDSLAGDLKWSKEARDAGLAGDDRVAGMVADATGLTEHNYISSIGSAVGLMLFGGLIWLRWKPLWEGWPFMRAKAWTGAVFFFIGFMTLITETCRGDQGGITGGIIFGGIGVWLFRSGIAKTRAIITHLSPPSTRG